MVGLLAGAALSAAGSIFGGISGQKTAEKQTALLAAQKANEQAYYDKNYNEDVFSTSDAQSAMKYAREQADKIFRKEAGAAAVAGATTASESAAKERANEMISNTASAIASTGSYRKDSLDANHLAQQNNFAQQEIATEGAKGNAIAGATKGVLGAAGNIFMASDTWGNPTQNATKVVTGNSPNAIIGNPYTYDNSTLV